MAVFAPIVPKIGTVRAPGRAVFAFPVKYYIFVVMKKLMVFVLVLVLGFSALAQPKEITVKADNISIEMVLIEPGSINVGDSLYKVEYPFYISKYPLTKAQWYAACSKEPLTKNHNNPVALEYVARDLTGKQAKPDANHEKYVKPFIDWVAAKSGKNLDIPTLEEWMLAFGPLPESAELEKFAWLDGGRHPVGKKEANVNGLYDIIGGLAEMAEVPSGGYCYIGGLPLISAKKQALKNPSILLIVRGTPLDNQWHPTYRLVLREGPAAKSVPAVKASDNVQPSAPDATAIKIARQMLAKGIPDATIAECTGLSLEVIAALK